MNKDKREIAGLAGTIAVHILVALLLWLVYVQKPADQEEGGVPVMMGEVDTANGIFEPATLTEVDVLPENDIPETSEPETNEPEMITQEDEPTVTIPEKKKPEKKEPEKPVSKPEKTKKPQEKTEAEKRAEAEKAAAEKAAKSIAGAFGKGAKMKDKGSGTTGKGIEGSEDGNASTGKDTGIGGYGTFDLNGRSLGEGGLPRPVYNEKDEGRVVVTITVDPSGKVIRTSINKRTNTVNAALRRAAEEAARQARFNRVEEPNDQTGTITYYFKLK